MDKKEAKIAYKAGNFDDILYAYHTDMDEKTKRFVEKHYLERLNCILDYDLSLDIDTYSQNTYYAKAHNYCGTFDEAWEHINSPKIQAVIEHDAYFTKQYRKLLESIERQRDKVKTAIRTPSHYQGNTGRRYLVETLPKCMFTEDFVSFIAHEAGIPDIFVIMTILEKNPDILNNIEILTSFYDNLNTDKSLCDDAEARFKKLIGEDKFAEVLRNSKFEAQKKQISKNQKREREIKLGGVKSIYESLGKTPLAVESLLRNSNSSFYEDMAKDIINAYPELKFDSKILMDACHIYATVIRWANKRASFDSIPDEYFMYDDVVDFIIRTATQTVQEETEKMTKALKDADSVSEQIKAKVDARIAEIKEQVLAKRTKAVGLSQDNEGEKVHEIMSKIDTLGV